MSSTTTKLTVLAACLLVGACGTEQPESSPTEEPTQVETETGDGKTGADETSTTDDPGEETDGVDEAVSQEEPVTFLLIGIDADSGSQRADVIMLVRSDGEREHLTTMSIPRDLWVEIPGRGVHKINAAYAFGGAELLTETVDGLYGSSIDHTLVVDFAAFTELSEILGPITVETADGPVTLEGEEALSFVRERYSLPGGDFGRVRRQQAFLAAVADSMKDASPAQLRDLANLAGEHIEVDGRDGMYSQTMLLSLMTDVVGPEQVFFTAPHDGTGWSEGGQSIVLVDKDATNALADAYETDTVSDWIESADPITLDNQPVN